MLKQYFQTTGNHFGYIELINCSS